MRGLSGEESGMALSKSYRRRCRTAPEGGGAAQPAVCGDACARRSARPSRCRRRRPPRARCRRSPAALPPNSVAVARLRRAEGGGYKTWILATAHAGGAAASRRLPGCIPSADKRRSNELRVRENERNQEAIMRLLDELSSLADGDLTVQATVTEDITGAIADSINYAIEALRELVTTINDSAIQLDGAAKQTQGAAAHMAKASSAQSRQISAASESMADMAASIEEVSGNSERCSDVARHSVDIAHKGGDAVRRTIDGMNAIRETIQETSKRIKRLGESSQEIGNIVELINDIAEQTNILALNASIQASMAGEAGRGFAVVADEVQRLAERAANATKQIEVLVRTIQTDTNEAVVSMERSTTDVVGGALLAENAGAALEEIEQVSNQIASLVQNISASARQQAAASGNISKNMQVVREISTQTAEGSTATSTSIAKLAALSAQLRKSVAGFRLARLRRRHDHAERRVIRVPAGDRARARPPAGNPGKIAQGERHRSVYALPDDCGMTDISSQTLHIVAKELATTLERCACRARGVCRTRRSAAFLEKCADQLHLAPRRAAPGRGVRRGAARRGNGTRHALSARRLDRQRPEAPGRRPRCADARDGAAAHLSGARALRRHAISRWCCCRCSTTCARCAAARCSPRARCCCSTSSPTSPPQPQSLDRRAIDFGGAMGAAPAAAVPSRPAGSTSAANARCRIWRFWRRSPRSSSKSRPLSRCSSCGGSPAPFSRRCARTVWRAAPR